jgi:hypothetical protein
MSLRDEKEQLAMKEIADTSLTVSKDNKLYHIFRFMQKSYGNDINRFLGSFNSILALSSLSRRIENKKLKFALNALKFGVPAFLHGAELYNNVKNYIRDLKGQQSPTYDKKVYRYCQMLDIKDSENEGSKLNEHDIYIDFDVISWLTMRPNAKTIKVLGLYNSETLAEMDSVNNLEKVKTPIAIKIQVDDHNYLLTANLITYSSMVYADKASIVGLLLSWEEGEKVRHAITCEFIESLNIDRNTLYFNSFGNIKCSPRVKIEEIINQYDVPAFIKEIRQVLDCGRKRAYVFVSRPGTGKSTLIKKIEETMTDIVIFRLSPEDLETPNRITDRFCIIRKINRCIVVIEDLDACDMKEKDSKTGIFLDAIDDVSNKLNMVILVTMNDTSRVHFSVINRPGRFDRIIEIKPPQTREEVYSIMLSKANKLKKNYCQGSCFGIPPCSWNEIEAIGVQTYEPSIINEDLLQQCLDNNYTQAEVADAVTEQIFIDASIDVKEKKKTWKQAYKNFNNYFKKAIASHESTRQALKDCDFKNEDPSNKLNKTCMPASSEPKYVRPDVRRICNDEEWYTQKS